jgi:fluoride exporter
MAAHWIAQQPTTRAKFVAWHTAAINIGGSFLLGGITSASTLSTTTTKAPLLSPRMKLCWGVGFCGSFTTFSTYSVDVVQWIAQGNVLRAAAYVLTNNVGSVAAAALGLVLVKKLLGG